MTGTRRWRVIGAAVLGAALLLLLVLAAFPWGMLRGFVERSATQRLGRPVRIGAVDRVDRFGFNPTIAVRDISVAQAAWVGPGQLAKVRSVTVSFPVWPLLLGQFRPRDVRADGVRLVLARDAGGRTNWEPPGKRKASGGPVDIGSLTVTNAVISYADAKQERRAMLRVAADPAQGLRVSGSGVVRGEPVRIAAAGPALARGRAWPFTARIDGAALAMTAKGSMNRPLDTGAMTINVTARATDLKLIDAVIEAGLFRTRPVSLTARVRHESERWTITGLTGRIGRSDLAGRATVDKVEGRSKIDAAITSRRFAFDDLTSPEGRTAAAALERRIGPRIIPNTRVDIGKIDTTDGRIAFRVGQIIGAGANAPVSALSGVMTMDHRLLTLAPLRLKLAQGEVTGRTTVDQRGGRASPVVTFDLRLSGGEVAGFAADSAFTGRLAARVRLKGAGDTIRAAVGRSSGSVGFVVRDGQLPQRYAAALGFDAGRALLADSAGRAGLRCLVTRLVMRGGTGRADSLIVDTDISQLSGGGTVSFPGETLALRLTGAPKRNVILRIPGSASVGGTLSAPHLNIPPQVKSAGNILRAIGNRVTGHSGPVATDANCAALAVRALR